VNNLKELNN